MLKYKNIIDDKEKKKELGLWMIYWIKILPSRCSKVGGPYEDLLKTMNWNPHLSTMYHVVVRLSLCCSPPFRKGRGIDVLYAWEQRAIMARTHTHEHTF